MASQERNLISKVLLTGDLSGPIDAGVTPKFFLDPEHRSAWETILSHNTAYGKVPSVGTFRKDFPAYKVTDPEEPLSYYVDGLVNAHAEFILETGVAEAIDAYEEDGLGAAVQRLATVVAAVNTDVSRPRATDITQTGSRRIERYVALGKAEGSLRGIPTGFMCLDRATLGWQPQQLVTLVGPAKAGKSTALLLSAIAAHKAVYRPLFIGFEMANEEQEERFDAIVSGVPHHKIRSGALSRDDFAALRRASNRNSLMPPLIFSEDTSAALTVSGISAQVEHYKPEIVFIDGVYMMEDERGRDKGSPQASTNITRDLKQLARNKEIPVVITTQVLESKMSRTKGVTTLSIGYSSSFLQDSDEVIAVENTDDSRLKKVKVLAGRNNPAEEWVIRWDWDTMRFEETVSTGDIDETTF